MYGVAGWPSATYRYAVRNSRISIVDSRFTNNDSRITIHEIMSETAKDKLKKMTAWDMPPELADAELDELLDQASKADAAGVAPGGVGWVPTYDLNAAAAAGWLIKAGRASMLVEVDPPGSGIYTSKVFDNCRAMAKTYSTRCRMTVGTGTITA
jgi:hypothetical protein